MNEPGRRNGQPPRPQRPGQGPETPPPSRFRIPNWIIIVVLVALALWYAYTIFWPSAPNRIDLPYSVMVEAVTADQVSSVDIEGQSVSGEFKEELRWTGEELLQPGQDIPPDVNADDIVESNEFNSTIPAAGDDTFVPLLLEHGVTVNVGTAGGSLLPELLISFLPLLLFLGLIIFLGRNMMRGQQNVFGFGRSRAKVYDAERPQITFADVAGEEEAKRELSEVVDFLKNPMKYHELGAKLPRGVLLVGPPGTGKTLLARAVAGEAAVPFFSVSASEFVEMFVGVGASRVRDLFQKAKAQSPAIVFVDELDAVGRQRFAGVGGSNDEREQTLNQLLVEMDGFDDRQEVIVLAATNRPDVLDPALLRPGRFDRQVTIGLPDKKGRVDVLKIHSRGIPIGGDVDLETIAGGTPGFSGADLANLVNEAALTAARHSRKVVTRADFSEALDKIILGTARAMLMNEQDRRVVAYHEAGHAVAAHFSPGADPLRKVSIVPRGRALGVTIQTPTDDRYNYSKQFLLGNLVTMMGGRAAEIYKFDEITTGAQNDLQQATGLARRMVGMWGMTDEVGPVYLGTGEQHVFLGRELTQTRDIGERTLDAADAAVHRLVSNALDEAQRLIVRHSAELEALVERLMVEETVDDDVLDQILGPKPIHEPAPVAAMEAASLDVGRDA
jgi:cell division protease FtsH